MSYKIEPTVGNSYVLTSDLVLTSDHITALEALEGVAEASLIHRYQINLKYGQMFEAATVTDRVDDYLKGQGIA